MKLSIIIPAYNEERTIAQLIAQVKAALLPKGVTREIIVVNDASTDSTPLILAHTTGIKVINHSVNRGKGAAIRTGIDSCTGETVLIQDADLEYNPNDYIRLITPILKEKAQVVYGTRFSAYPLRLLGATTTPMPFHYIGNKLLTALTNLLFNAHITDMETCYKVFNTRLIKSLHLVCNRFDFEPEVTAKLLKRGVEIVEVPIKVVPRGYSEGKKIAWSDGLFAIRVLLRERFV